jgi:hypothetical protein
MNTVISKETGTQKVIVAGSNRLFKRIVESLQVVLSI